MSVNGDNHLSFDSPDEQVNCAIKLILNAYEVKSEYYENEIKRMHEEYEQKTSEYEKNISEVTREKENLEAGVEKLISENKSLLEKLEIAANENKKLEKLKTSILSSINSNDGVMITGSPMKSSNINSSRPTSNPKYVSTLNNINVNTKQIHKHKLSSEENSITQQQQNKDNRIEMLIEKLNDSINNRIYTNQEDNQQTYKKFENYISNESNLNKTVEDLKMKIKNNLNNYKTQNTPNNQNSFLHQNYTMTDYSNKNNLKHEYQLGQIGTPKNYKNIDKDYYTDQGMKNTKSTANIPVKKSNYLKTRTESQSKEDYYEDEDNKKTNQYVQSSKFFANCRARLNEEEYSKLISTLRLCNNNKIDKFEAFKRIEKILVNYDFLLRDFKSIFPSN